MKLLDRWARLSRSWALMFNRSRRISRREGRIKVRTIKLIGLAALAALSAMALVGASSAMAEGSTALCKVDQTPCAAGNLFGPVHEESVGKAVLLSSSL